MFIRISNLIRLRRYLCMWRRFDWPIRDRLFFPAVRSIEPASRVSIVYYFKTHQSILILKPSTNTHFVSDICTWILILEHFKRKTETLHIQMQRESNNERWFAVDACVTCFRRFERDRRATVRHITLALIIESFIQLLSGNLVLITRFNNGQTIYEWE